MVFHISSIPGAILGLASACVATPTSQSMMVAVAGFLLLAWTVSTTSLDGGRLRDRLAPYMAALSLTLIAVGGLAAIWFAIGGVAW